MAVGVTATCIRSITCAPPVWGGKGLQSMGFPLSETETFTSIPGIQLKLFNKCWNEIFILIRSHGDVKSTFLDTNASSYRLFLKGSWDFMTFLGQIRTDWSFCFGLGEAYTCSSTPLYIYIKTISNSLKIPGNATSNRVSSPFFSTLPLCVEEPHLKKT